MIFRYYYEETDKYPLWCQWCNKCPVSFRFFKGGKKMQCLKCRRVLNNCIFKIVNGKLYYNYYKWYFAPTTSEIVNTHSVNAVNAVDHHSPLLNPQKLWSALNVKCHLTTMVGIKSKMANYSISYLKNKY